jgi:hypothetical protein
MSVSFWQWPFGAGIFSPLDPFHRHCGGNAKSAGKARAPGGFNESGEPSDDYDRYDKKVGEEMIHGKKLMGYKRKCQEVCE